MNKKIFLLSLLVLSGVFYVLNTPVVLADDISPASINWLHTNVGGWSVTSTITKVDITSDTICIYHTKAGQWPPSQFDTIQIEGNPWIFAKINGQWHGATWDWLRVGQQCKGMTAIEIGKDQIRIPPLDSSWVPQQGDQIGFMMSARARDDVRTVTERSDIVVVTWPYSSGGGGGTQPPIQPSNLPTVPAVPPVITGFNPTSAVPGQSVEVYGTNLSNKIKLVAGSTSRDVESSADNQFTTSTFEVPSDIAQGTYKISVTNSKGTATSTQSLTVKVGGPPFLNPVSPPVPTKGLPTNLGQLIQQIFTWSLGILGISVFVMFFYSGFLYLTAAGNTVKTGEARQHMTNAIFGAILLLSSYLILYTINPDFVKNTFNLPGLGTTNSNNTISATPPSSQSLNNAAAQIRTFNNLLNEYNTYNNAAKQMNTNNNPL